jgi:ParB family chromosome partitioning protein
VIAPTSAGDSGGITGQSAVLPLARLAAHPRNPRGDLGDLAELTASVHAHGVFEPLVVLSAAAYAAAANADGDPERTVGDCTHVIVMGHRRAAAARAAGLAEVPVVIRDDLAGAPALAAMIAENLHREALTPLAEAAAMAELARRGWAQRKIAAEIGCSQAHVSKRLALLELPVPARAAVSGGQLSAGQALELHKATGAADDDIAADVIGKAVADIEAGYPADNAVAAAHRDATRFQAARKTRAELEARGIEIITPERRIKMGWPYVTDREMKHHEKAGCLAASIDYNGRPDYACTNPAGHPGASPAGTARARELKDEREIRKAAKARDAACAAIAAGPLPAVGELSRILAAALLDSSGYAEAMRLACKWLRAAGLAPTGADHYAVRDQLTAAGNHVGLARYAFAVALAADELHARPRYHIWGARDAAHLARLAESVGYQPTDWERARLSEARQVTEARAILACPDCGCTGAPAPAGCDVTFDRTAGKPVYECRWDCRTHKTRRNAASREPAVTGAPHGAGDSVPDGLPDDPPGSGPSEDNRSLTALAAPQESLWTPDLRAALEGLMQ